MRILDVLKGSYTIREQAAASYIEELEKSLTLIKKTIVDGDLFTSPSDLLSLIDGVLSNGEE